MRSGCVKKRRLKVSKREKTKGRIRARQTNRNEAACQSEQAESSEKRRAACNDNLPERKYEK